MPEGKEAAAVAAAASHAPRGSTRCHRHHRGEAARVEDGVGVERRGPLFPTVSKSLATIRAEEKCPPKHTSSSSSSGLRERRRIPRKMVAVVARKEKR